MEPKTHWNAIYKAKGPTEVSWFQSQAGRSLELIRLAAPESSAEILDVGGGASTLVDGLLKAGYARITVLDLSGVALAQARKRIGAASARVSWREADILEARLASASFDLWHDRAVFHFLTQPGERHRYLEQVRRAVRPGGHVVVATFACDGPTRCSGLEVARYDAETLHGEFGDSFRLLRDIREEHTTPSGARQSFLYCLFRHQPAQPAG